ncbi:C-type lectin domain family member A-like protein [Labeo rohita]|uniref:C-type lectin domain family member A-like protein n=1 Tax=Labeo rohita TaxID=84645 RepID=A0A498MVJ7_LABRO|nr:C-type lectin domain family member A-like protein [Labeo rohita]
MKKLRSNNENLTNEREHLILKNTNLTNEKEQLILNNTNLTNEREHLILKNTNLTNEKEQLILNNTNLTNEKEQLILNNTNLTNEREHLILKNTNLTNEKEQLILNNTNLTNEKEQLILNNTNLTNEREHLILKNTNLTNEREELILQICRKVFLVYIVIFCTADIFKDFVHNMTGATIVYIGLTDVVNEGTWKWVDGTNMTSSPWSDKEPNGLKDENCAAILHGRWIDEPFIVLYVTLIQERQHLISKNAKLTNEKDQLLLKNTNLTNERDQLRNELQICVEWTSYQSSFYYMSKEMKNWTESRRYCTERGADLIIINNREEQDFVLNMTANAAFYIGLTDVGVEGTWQWVDGTFPRQMSVNENKKITAELVLLTAGWTFYNSTCYFMSNVTKNWTESRLDYLKRIADLIIINNRQEQDFVHNMTGAPVYIGLTDIDVEGTWKWVDGSTLTSGEDGESTDNIYVDYVIKGRTVKDSTQGKSSELTVIVLSSTFTYERQQLISKNETLTNERDQSIFKM